MGRLEDMGVSRGIFLKAAFGSLAFVLLFLHSFIDQFFVTLEGSVAVTAYTLDLPIYWMIIGICSAFGMVAALGVKRRMESGDVEGAGGFALTALVYSVLIGLCVQAIMVSFSSYYIEPLQDEDVLQDAVDFLLPFWYLFFGIAFNSVLASLLSIDGGQRRLILCLVVSLVTNCVLDPVFVNVMHMGIFGNGLGTAVSLLVSFLLGLEWFLSRRGTIRLTLKGFDFGLSGLLMSLQAIRHFFVRGFVKNICELMMRMAVFTTHALSYGIPLLCTTLAYMLCTGVTPALGAEYNRLYGERDVDGARRLLTGSAITMLLSMSLFSAVVFILADPIAHIFTLNPSLTEKHSVIVGTLRILIFSVPFYGMKFVGRAALAPRGNTNSSTVAVVIWCILRLALFLFIVQYSYIGAMVMLAVERIVVGVASYLYALHFIRTRYAPVRA